MAARVKKETSILERLVPILALASIILAFVVGVLWQKVQQLEKGGTTVAGTGGTTGTNPSAGQAAPAAATASLDQIKKLFGQDLIKFGDDKRKLLLVAAEDPSCPYCHIASGLNPELSSQAGDRFKYVSEGGTYVPPIPEMKKLVDQGKASLVYIYTPGHGAGEMGMRALYCAFEKGKFWQVHDLLYTNEAYNLLNNTVKNDKTKSGDLANFLKSVVNVNEMKACLESSKYDQRLTSDTNLAGSLGIRGTPGFYLNETNFAGAYSWKDMEGAANAALGS